MPGMKLLKQYSIKRSNRCLSDNRQVFLVENYPKKKSIDYQITCLRSTTGRDIMFSDKTEHNVENVQSDNSISKIH